MTRMFQNLFLGICALMASSSAFAATNYNVLFISVDDMRPELGSFGNKVVKTPNMDRLAARGIVFRHAYVQQAVCSPSRSSLITGRRPDATRVWDLETHFRAALPEPGAYDRGGGSQQRCRHKRRDCQFHGCRQSRTDSVDDASVQRNRGAKIARQHGLQPNYKLSNHAVVEAIARAQGGNIVRARARRYHHCDWITWHHTQQDEDNDRDAKQRRSRHEQTP